MKTAIFITAKVGSSRLPNKHFMSIDDKPIMQYLIDHIRRRLKNPIYIIAGDFKQNEVFSKVFEGCHVFYDVEKNIPQGHLDAAQMDDIDRVIAVDGDDILCSPEAMSYVMEMLDRLECVKTAGLPLGMNAFGYRVTYLEEAMRGLEDKIIRTGWGRVFPSMTTLAMKSRNRPYLRFTLDYMQDYKFFKKVIQGLGPLLIDATDDQIIEYVLRSRAYKENEGIAEDYWKNFQQGMDAE